MKVGAAKYLAPRALYVDLLQGVSAGGAGQDALRSPPLKGKVRVILWLRVILVTALFLATIASSYGDGAFVIPSDVFTLFVLLLLSLAFGLLCANAIHLKISGEIVAVMQVGWDLIFSASWIFSTGGTGSLFLFLYLFVIIEASFLLDQHGIILTAFLCAILFWGEMHLEFHHVLHPTRTITAAPIVTWPSDYPLANFIFFVFAVLSSAWLASYLKQRFSTTRLLLQERTENIQDLLHLNESIVRCVRSGLITLDTEQRVTSANEAASNITCYAESEMLGRKVVQFMGEVPLNEVERQEALSSFPFRWEQPFTKKDGSVLTLGCSGAVLRDHKEDAFGHLIIFQDLTYYKQIEEGLKRAEKMAAIGELAAGLAHEIRNPLASLYGSVQLLQGENPQERSQQRLMRIVLQEGERLNSLISDFLQFASPHADQKEDLSILQLLEETLELFQQSPDVHDDIRFSVRIDPSVRIHANRKQLLQVLWNLLLNAVQAMPDGGTLTLEAKSVTSGVRRPYTALTVRDTGNGILKENLNKIFDPFFTSRHDGTGLGLAVVYRIVDNHDGKIHVNSEVGCGTEFHIEWPCMDEEEARDTASLHYQGGLE